MVLSNNKNLLFVVVSVGQEFRKGSTGSSFLGFLVQLQLDVSLGSTPLRARTVLEPLLKWLDLMVAKLVLAVGGNLSFSPHEHIHGTA